MIRIANKKVIKQDSKQPSKEEMQQKAVEFELMRQEVANIDKQIQELQLRQVELLTIRQSIESIKEAEDSELLVPLGSGVYINSKLTNGKSLLINVGAGVVIEKSMDQASGLIDSQIDSINNIITELDSNAEEFVKRMHEIEISLSV